tara:strand:- start:279 stop:488 length:210 start_codon:yes stop_codon:yes gene_type:complete
MRTRHSYITAPDIDDLRAGNAFAFASAASGSSLHSVHIYISALHFYEVSNDYHTDVTAPTIQHDMILID